METLVVQGFGLIQTVISCNTGKNGMEMGISQLTESHEKTVCELGRKLIFLIAHRGQIYPANSTKEYFSSFLE